MPGAISGCCRLTSVGAVCALWPHVAYRLLCDAAGREILQQTGGQLDAFVSGAGTGGTIAGVSRVLKAHNPHIQVVLADPQGSSLFNKVVEGWGQGVEGAGTVNSLGCVCVLAQPTQRGIVEYVYMGSQLE